MCVLRNNSSANFSNAGALPANTGSSAASSDHLLTGIQNVDAIIAGTYWTTTKLKFTFPTRGDWFPLSLDQSRNVGFAPFSENDKAAVRLALNNQFSSVSLLTFEEMDAEQTRPVGAQLTFAYSTWRNAAGWANYPSSHPTGGDTWYVSANLGGPLSSIGQYGWQTLLHETGHALGLKHGHYELSWDGRRPSLTSDRDTQEFSVMTYNYFSSTHNGVDMNKAQAQSLGMYDIAALQALYGANFNTNSTNSVYSFTPITGAFLINGAEQGRPSADPNGVGGIFMTIWDGGGLDTYDFSNHGDSQQISLEPGNWSLFSLAQRSGYARANVYNALQFQGDTRSLIENAIGGPGSDSIVGNLATNQLTGGGGDDTLDGGAATDSLHGGDGNDTFLVGSGDFAFGGVGEDVAIIGLARHSTTIAINGNVQTLRNGTFSATLTDIEILHFLGESSYRTDTITVRFSGTQILHTSLNPEKRYLVFGNSLANNVVGNNLAETLDGGAGNDVIEGRSGDDSITGGLGDDALYGGDGNNTLRGGAGNDTLVGDIGDDYLHGLAGSDRIDAGTGNDIVQVDWGDTVLGGTGDDLAFLEFARAGVSTTVNGNVYTLRNGSLSLSLTDVERVQFQGESTPTAIATLASSLSQRTVANQLADLPFAW
jgi:serralysin